MTVSDGPPSSREEPAGRRGHLWHGKGCLSMDTNAQAACAAGEAVTGAAAQSLSAKQ